MTISHLEWFFTYGSTYVLGNDSQSRSNQLESQKFLGGISEGVAEGFIGSAFVKVIQRGCKTMALAPSGAACL